MKGWLLRRIQARFESVPIHLHLHNDGMVVCIGWKAGWLSGEVRLAPDDARVLSRCLAVMAHDADEAMAEAIR